MSHNKGFTLAEVTIAALIIGLGILPVLSVFITGTGQVERGREFLSASMTAQHLIDIARGDDFIWEKIPQEVNLPEDTSYPMFKLPLGMVKQYGAKAVIKTEYVDGIKDKNGLVKQSLIQISVKITWKEKGKNLSTQLVTFKALTDHTLIHPYTRM